MKKGKTLTELAQTLEMVRNTSKDFIVPVEKMEATVRELPDPKDPEVLKPTPVLNFQNNGSTGSAYVPNEHAHIQLAGYTDIPRNYYQRIANENPALLVENINHGLKRFGGESRMLRTVNGSLRAFLSSKYRRLDSYDLLETVLPVLIENKFEVESTEYTEQRMYLKVISPRIESEIKKGDVVRYGLVISSSDVGAGSLRVEPLVERLVCLNGMIMSHALRKFHIGRDIGEQEVYELLTENTKDLTDKAFWAQVKDIVLASMSTERFEAEVNRLREAANQKITNFDLPLVVELSMKAVGVGGETTKDSIVAYLANGADGAGLNKWGLINGFTWAAQQKHVGYDESVTIERAASKILDLAPRQWARIADKE